MFVGGGDGRLEMKMCGGYSCDGGKLKKLRVRNRRRKRMGGTARGKMVLVTVAGIRGDYFGLYT